MEPFFRYLTYCDCHAALSVERVDTGEPCDLCHTPLIVRPIEVMIGTKTIIAVGFTSEDQG